MIYHIGFIKHGDMLIVQARQIKDTLSPELWQYQGRRETTKRKLYLMRFALLNAVNKDNNTRFKRIRID